MSEISAGKIEAGDPFPALRIALGICAGVMLILWAAYAVSVWPVSRQLIPVASAVLYWTGWGTFHRRLSRRFDIFELINAIFLLFAFSFPVRALFAASLEESWAGRSTIAALVVAAIGYLFFLAGYRASGAAGLAPRTWDAVRTRRFVLLLAILSIGAILAVWATTGHWDFFISIDPDIKSPDAMPAWFFYAFWGALLLQVGAAIQVAAQIALGGRLRFTVLYCLLALGSTVLTARISTVFLLAMVALILHYSGTRIPRRYVVIAGILLLAYLMLAGFYREFAAADSAGLSAEDVLEKTDNSLAFRYVAANFEQLGDLATILESVPTELPYQHGWTFAPLLLKPIPRQLMQDKPLGASALYTREFTPSNYDAGFVTTISATSEFYMNFGILGIVLGMYVIGRLSARAQALAMSGQLHYILLASVAYIAMLTWVRMDFNAACTHILFYGIPVVFAIWYCTQKAPAR